jgi:hypothetical protein
MAYKYRYYNSINRPSYFNSIYSNWIDSNVYWIGDLLYNKQNKKLKLGNVDGNGMPKNYARPSHYSQ